jgi:hypothetical protein
MITKKNDEISNNSASLNKSYVGVRIIPMAALLLILLSTVNLMAPSDYTTTAVFTQGQTNNTNTLTSTTSIGADTTTQALNSTLVDFASNIEQIRGHLNAAVMNKQAGNNTLAEAHTLHPIAEIYSSIEPQITTANSTLNQTLSSNLNQLSQMVSNSTVDEFDMQAQKVNALLNQTVEQVVPVETANNATFNLMVVADVLPIASTEYGEAVENGTVKEIVEYQDGQAFVSRAQPVFGQTSSRLPQEMASKIQETNQFFSDLNNTIQDKSNPEVINTSIRAVIHEISEITGISEESLAGEGTGTEPGEIISEIRILLNQTIEEYKQQNYAEAEALAISAYLDNFEFIESPLAEKDSTLMVNTEIMLREQLRQLIQNKVSIEELQEHIDKINSNLDKAEKLLGATS